MAFTKFSFGLLVSFLAKVPGIPIESLPLFASRVLVLLLLVRYWEFSLVNNIIIMYIIGQLINIITRNIQDNNM